MVFPAVFNVSSLNGKNGFVINNPNNVGYNLLYSVSGVGDVNGDGIDDIITLSNVIFGSKYEFPAMINSTWLNGQNGFIISNYTDINSVSGAGDVNADGIDDIVITGDASDDGDDDEGAFGTGEKSYIIFGSKEEFPMQFSLKSLNGLNGFIIKDMDKYPGFAGRAAGDINDDGIDDLVIMGVDAPDLSCILFGNKCGFFSPLSLTNLNGHNGFTFNVGGYYSGNTISEAGDINSDGIADIIIGSVIGQSYVVFGSKAVFPVQFNFSSLNGTNGFTINGGYVVSNAGDINSDGIDDIIIGAPDANNQTGQSCVVFGSKVEFPAQLNITDLNGTNGFTINGINIGDESGNSVSGAGDVNADGIDDLIIANGNQNNLTGQSYVVFGSKAIFPAQFNLTDLNGVNGFTINSINTGGHICTSVSGAGDVNADGIADIIIGAPNGVDYVIFGERFSADESELIGNALSNLEDIA